MRFLRLASLIAALAVASAACGSSAATAAPADGSAPGSATPTPTPAATDAGGNPTVSLPAMPAAGGGSCKVQITGDVNKSWEASQTQGTLLLSQWLSSSDRELMSIAADEDSMILNCSTDAGTANFSTTSGTTSALFPKAPGTYVIATGGLGSDKPGQIGVLVNTKDKLLWKTSEPGAFTIKSFGGGKFAGSFTVKLVTYLDSGSTHSSATMTGTFDLGCTGSACS
jgi:hypothetical protein